MAETPRTHNLEPTSFEEILSLSDRPIKIPKCELVFKQWTGEPIRNTYNNKAVVDWNGEPLFAELAILRLLQADGWDGVWVDSYRNKYRVGLPERAEPIPLPPNQEKFLDAIRQRTGRRGGCWDVFVWRGNEHKFVESKRVGKDAIRESQILWLEKSLEAGLWLENFLLAEWNLAK